MAVVERLRCCTQSGAGAVGEYQVQLQSLLLECRHKLANRNEPGSALTAISVAAASFARLLCEFNGIATQSWIGEANTLSVLVNKQLQKLAAARQIEERVWRNMECVHLLCNLGRHAGNRPQIADSGASVYHLLEAVNWYLQTAEAELRQFVNCIAEQLDMLTNWAREINELREQLTKLANAFQHSDHRDQLVQMRMVLENCLRLLISGLPEDFTLGIIETKKFWQNRGVEWIPRRIRTRMTCAAKSANFKKFPYLRDADVANCWRHFYQVIDWYYREIYLPGRRPADQPAVEKIRIEVGYDQEWRLCLKQVQIWRRKYGWDQCSIGDSCYLESEVQQLWNQPGKLNQRRNRFNCQASIGQLRQLLLHILADSHQPPQVVEVRVPGVDIAGFPFDQVILQPLWHKTLGALSPIRILLPPGEFNSDPVEGLAIVEIANNQDPGLFEQRCNCRRPILALLVHCCQPEELVDYLEILRERNVPFVTHRCSANDYLRQNGAGFPTDASLAEDIRQRKALNSYDQQVQDIFGAWPDLDPPKRMPTFMPI